MRARGARIRLARNLRADRRIHFTELAVPLNEPPLALMKTLKFAPPPAGVAHTVTLPLTAALALQFEKFSCRDAPPSATDSGAWNPVP